MIITPDPIYCALNTSRFGYSSPFHVISQITFYKSDQKYTTAKVWPGSPSAHRWVLGGSPLYPGGLQAALGGFRRLQAAVHLPEYSSPEDRLGCRVGREKAHLHILAEGKISRAASIDNDDR